MSEDWNEEGARSFTEARRPKRFIEQHIVPLLAQPARSAKEKARPSRRKTPAPNESGEGNPSTQRDEVFAIDREFWRQAES